MTSRPVFAAAVLAALACGSRPPLVTSVEVAHVAFDMNDDWHEHRTTQRGVVTAEFEPDDNDRKESITVIRTERSVAAAQGSPAITNLLAHAERTDPSRVTSVATAHGLRGARVDVDFTPPGAQAAYHRVHVVLVDGQSLVHVLYTARSPDDSFAVFNRVLASIHHTDS